MMTHKWQFTSSFRYHAFGWRSDKPILRIKEAITEIKQVSKTDPKLAAEGGVLFLEKLSPAIAQVDSSSGAIGTAVNRAIAILVPIIAKADVTPAIRERWLERLWEALQTDEMSYLDDLGYVWGTLCVTPEIANCWADFFLPSVMAEWEDDTSHRYFRGTSACLSAYFAAGRYQNLLLLLESTPYISWNYRQWGVKALVALGKKSEAIRYAEQSKGLNDSSAAIAAACEDILLSSGFAEEAYKRYALSANLRSTHLATFRALAKKYPNKPVTDILADLIANSPSEEGKWFAAAKDAGCFELAIELVKKSPTDPRTLIRAARDYAEEQPEFAISAGLLALQWMARGYGYQITADDILMAYSALVKASSHANKPVTEMHSQIYADMSAQPKGGAFVISALETHFAKDLPATVLTLD